VSFNFDHTNQSIFVFAEFGFDIRQRRISIIIDWEQLQRDTSRGHWQDVPRKFSRFRPVQLAWTIIKSIIFVMILVNVFLLDWLGNLPKIVRTRHIGLPIPVFGIPVMPKFRKMSEMRKKDQKTNKICDIYRSELPIFRNCIPCLSAH
jgi:hypothetical protein